MQNTRLNSLLSGILKLLDGWIQNPWRRISLLIISLLFGNFLATAFSTISGQEANLDVTISFFLVLVTEAISWLKYGSRLRESQGLSTPRQRSLLVEMLNGTKLGLIYGLFVEAFKLGS